MRLKRMKTRNIGPKVAKLKPIVEVTIPLRRNGQRDWNGVRDEQIVGYAKKFIDENGIEKISELQRINKGLYIALRRRNLLEKIKLEKSKRDWASMSDWELLNHAKRFLKEKGINRSKDFEKADRGMYYALVRRRLICGLELIENRRAWSLMNNAELVEYAKRFLQDNSISGRSELSNKDRGLYAALRGRGLLDRVGFEQVRRKYRQWAEMNDEKLIEFAKRFMKEDGICGRHELEKADRGLYYVLGKRELLDSVGFKQKKRGERPWKGMQDEEIVELAKTFMEENGISGRHELNRADRGLYEALRRRKLLNLVFSDIDQSQSERAIEQIIDFTASYGERG